MNWLFNYQPTPDHIPERKTLKEAEEENQLAADLAESRLRNLMIDTMAERADRAAKN